MNEERHIEQQDSIVSLGKKLADLRNQLGLSEQDVAHKIYVRTTLIQNIENDKTDKIPAVFLRGYIKSYAKLVGLPESDYQPYLNTQQGQQPISVMRNYSNREQNKRNTKRILLISLLVILMIIGVTSFVIWKDSRNNLVEVSHYISPAPDSTINS